MRLKLAIISFECRLNISELSLITEGASYRFYRESVSRGCLLDRFQEKSLDGVFYRSYVEGSFLHFYIEASMATVLRLLPDNISYPII